MATRKKERAAKDGLRQTVDPAPHGWDRLRWLGPGLLWMVSSVGSGSVLFTPRVGSRYGLELLWIAVLGGFLTWVIIMLLVCVYYGSFALFYFHGLLTP